MNSRRSTNAGKCRRDSRRWLKDHLEKKGRCNAEWYALGPLVSQFHVVWNMQSCCRDRCCFACFIADADEGKMHL